MDAKVIYIAGVPASGKSTLFRLIRKHLFDGAKEFRIGKCRGIESKCGKFKMLGVFDGSKFEGTDKLSMTVINDAISYLKGIMVSLLCSLRATGFSIIASCTKPGQCFC